jgi:23S rRNA pseudouridine1911/1915/1917 synthase
LGTFPNPPFLKRINFKTEYFLCSVLSVLFEDNHLIAINKPAGLAVQGDATGDRHLLDEVADYLKKKYQKPGNAFVGLIHRLDRPVSGVVLLAKTSKALTRMNAQFRDKETKKIYHALSFFEPQELEGTLHHFLGKDAKTHRALTYNQARPGAKEAILHYVFLRKVNQGLLFEVTLETGRFHQIRAQFSKAGMPLAGDLKYGAKDPLPDRSIGLHARALSFVHPVTEELISLVAAYPKLGIWPKK